MTDKEFKRLRRADLIEIIYRLQENEENYKKAIARMARQLEDKKIRLAKAGSIAEAALSLSGVLDAAQDAADRYLEEIRDMHAAAEAELADARKEAAGILEKARRQAAAITKGDTQL